MTVLTSKHIKHINDFNQVVKNSFRYYALRYNGEASAPLKHHKIENVLSFSRTDLPIYEFFDHLGIPADHVLYIDSIAMFKAFQKKSAIDHCFILDGVLTIVSTNVAAAKDTPWEIFNNVVYIPVAEVIHYEEAKKPFLVNQPLFNSMDGFVECTDKYLEDILAKKMVMMEHNDYVVGMGKPLLPAISGKCKLYMNFIPHTEELFKAQVMVEKEQVYNYHTYIAYSIFN